MGIAAQLERYKARAQSTRSIGAFLTDTAFITPFNPGTALQDDARYWPAGYESRCLVREVPGGESVPIDDEGGELDVDIYELWVDVDVDIAPDYQVIVNGVTYLVTGVIDASTHQLFRQVEIRRPRSG